MPGREHGSMSVPCSARKTPRRRSEGNVSSPAVLNRPRRLYVSRNHQPRCKITLSPSSPVPNTHKFLNYSSEKSSAEDPSLQGEKRVAGTFHKRAPGLPHPKPRPFQTRSPLALLSPPRRSDSSQAHGVQISGCTDLLCSPPVRWTAISETSATKSPPFKRRRTCKPTARRAYASTNESPTRQQSALNGSEQNPVIFFFIFIKTASFWQI